MNDIVFIDRDGPILKSHKTDERGAYFNIHQDKFDFCNKSMHALALLKANDIQSYIITNQAWVEDADDFKYAYESNSCFSDLVTGVYITTNKSEGESRARSKASMLYHIIHRYKEFFDYTFWIIGDSQSDIDAGKMTGCKTIQILTRFGDRYKDADYKCVSLYDAVQVILNERRRL